MADRGNEIKVGLLVVVTVVLLLVAVFMGKRFNPLRIEPNFYKARFSNVGGLAQGSPVRFGGLTVGRVEDIQVVGDTEFTIEVLVSVDPHTPVKRDSQAAITSLGLLGDNYVEIDLGSADSPRLPSGEYLINKQYPGLPEIFAKVDSAMVDAQELIKNLNSQLNRISDKADTLLTDIDKTFADQNQQKLTSILTETDNLIKGASPRVNETLEHIKTAATRLDPILANVDKTVKDVNTLVGNIDAVVLENRPEILKVLEDLDTTLLDAKATILEVQAMLRYNRTNLDILIENLAASSDNIREFTDTVKQHPFSLIRMPSKKPRIPPELPK